MHVPFNEPDGKQQAATGELHRGLKSVRAAALGPLAARMTSLVLSGLGSIVYAKLLIDHIGASAFGVASLFVAIMWILPVLVDGSRTEIVNTLAGNRSDTAAASHEAERRMLRASRRQLAIGIGVAVIGTTAFLAMWAVGDDMGWAFLALGVGLSLAVSAAFSPGAAVLQGIGRQAALSLTPILTTALSLPLLWLLLESGLGVVGAVAAPAAGALLALALYVTCVRLWGLPVRSVRGLSTKPQHAQGSLALSATGFTVVMVLMFMSDRYLLMGAGPLFLATFALLQQLSVPLMALTGSVGGGLWAFVEAQRGLGRDTTKMRLGVIGISGAIALGLGFCVALGGAWFVEIMLGEAVEGSRQTSAYLGVLVAMSGLNDGASALLRNAQGLRTLTVIWTPALVLKAALMPIAVSLATPTAGVAVSCGVFTIAVALTLVAALRAPSANRLGATREVGAIQCSAGPA